MTPARQTAMTVVDAREEVARIIGVAEKVLPIFDAAFSDDHMREALMMAARWRDGSTPKYSYEYLRSSAEYCGGAYARVYQSFKPDPRLDDVLPARREQAAGVYAARAICKVLLAILRVEEGNKDDALKIVQDIRGNALVAVGLTMAEHVLFDRRS